MKLKFLQFTFAFFAISLIYLSTSSYSANPPNSAAAGGCSCHGPASASTEVLYSFNNGSLTYVNGQTYTLVVEVKSNTLQPAVGFIASANIGTFGTAPAGTAKSGTTTKYWKHTTPAATTNMGSYTAATFTINWTAPTAGSTALVFNVAGIAADLSGDTGGDEQAIGTLAPSSPLAITFKKLEVSLDNNLPTCKWEVTNQTDCKQYDVQTSINGVDFKTIQTVLPNNMGNYTVTDANKYTTNNIYYRINAIKFNGTNELSITKQLYLPTQNTISIYPTTINGSTTLHINQVLPSTNLYIYNLQGALMQKIDCSKQSAFILANYAKGIYIAVIKSKEQILLQQKIVVE